MPTLTDRLSVSKPTMEPLISLQILNAKQTYWPGDGLHCEYQIDAIESDELQAIEASVLWHTEGKGDEDLGVHFFQRRVTGDATESDLRELHRFQTTLPNSPLSYSGAIVKLRWCARVRVFLRRGRELFFEQPFTLGTAGLPSPDVVSEACQPETSEPTPPTPACGSDAELATPATSHGVSY